MNKEVDTVLLLVAAFLTLVASYNTLFSKEPVTLSGLCWSLVAAVLWLRCVLLNWGN